MITSQKDLRAAFWAEDAELKRRFWMPSWTQNQYCTDVRMAWCDFVESMKRNGQISSALANRATL